MLNPGESPENTHTSNIQTELDAFSNIYVYHMHTFA